MALLAKLTSRERPKLTRRKQRHNHCRLPEALDFTYKSNGGRLTQRDAARCYSHASMLTGSLLTRKCLPQLFPRRKEGILRDVFIQKAVVAWDSAPRNRIMVSLLLPGPMEMDQWLRDVRASINMWPLQKTAHVMTNQLARERRRLQARHIWEKIEPDWPMIKERVWTKQATGLPYEALFRRLFLPRLYGRIPVAGKFLQGTALALDPTAVEALPGLVCRTSRCAVSESMGQYSVSP